MPVTWLYFGCHGRPGHNLWSPGMQPVHLPPEALLRQLDGRLACQRNLVPYRGVLSRLGGFGFSALAFWDHTLDARSGSNSAILASDMAIRPASLLDGLQQHFPEVWTRLPPITLAPWHGAADHPGDAGHG